MERPNLFWSTRKLTTAKEDHLTEFFATALVTCKSFGRAYFDLVIRPYARQKKWGDCRIVDVKTQEPIKGSSCRPDMLLALSNGKRIACEHKIEAMETMGPEREPEPQLTRYLRLAGVDGVVYVRATSKPPADAVVNHDLYIQPAAHPHFMWRDFYPLLKRSKGLLVRWLRDAFDQLGYTPPTQIGHLRTEQERRNFAKLWTPTREYAHELGWKVGTGSIVQLYLRNNSRSMAETVFIQPITSRLQMRVTPRRRHLDTVMAKLKAAKEAPPRRWQVQLEQNQVRRASGRTDVVDLYVAQEKVLGRVKLAPDKIADRLCAWVRHFLDPLQL